MTPLYNMIMSGMNQAPQQMATQMPMMNMGALNPIQKMQQVMQAMQNPVAFIKNAFPDIPANIQNNPAQILSYIQQTRNISNSQIQDIMNQIPKY